jgi:phage repressor protein C with HTH and peptisase S24 domain
MALQADNDAYESFDLLHFDAANIIGPVVGVYRSFAS